MPVAKLSLGAKHMKLKEILTRWIAQDQALLLSEVLAKHDNVAVSYIPGIHGCL